MLNFDESSGENGEAPAIGGAASSSAMPAEATSFSAEAKVGIGIAGHTRKRLIQQKNLTK